MIASNIRIEHIKVNELISFAENVIRASSKGQFVPITMQRAVAHAHNPYAAKDDVTLLVAIDSDEEVVGYFGILPLLLRDGKNYHKVHWFTTWNVSEKVRGQGVGGDLMNEALTLSHDFLIVGSIHARRVCRKYGFWERDPLVYYWLDPSGMANLNPVVWVRRGYRKFLHLLGLKKQVKITSPLSETFDETASPYTRKIFLSRLERLESELSDGFQFREVEQIHAEPAVPPHRPQVELHRGIEAINWMLANPWVVETGSSVTEEMDYYFSDTRSMYQQNAIEIYDQTDRYLGFAVFSISKQGDTTVVKTRDFRLEQPSYERTVLALALQYGRAYNATAIELPAEIIIHLPQRLQTVLLQSKERIYQCMPKSDDSPLARVWDQINLHLWDGDMAFS